MNFNDWLTELKTADPKQSGFITKLEPFLSESGFNSTEFEKKIMAGLKKIDQEIDQSLNPEPNA